MGADTILHEIAGSSYVEGLKKVNYKEIRMQYSDKEFTSGILSYKIYIPTRRDYEVTAFLVDQVISEGYNIIVYDSWIVCTDGARNYANSQNIKLYSYVNFVNHVKSGKSL